MRILRSLEKLASLVVLTATFVGGCGDDQQTDHPDAREQEPDANDVVDAGPSGVLITEVLSSDVTGEADYKYVEIYNATAAAVSLQGWKLRPYANGSATSQANQQLTFGAVSIAPGATFVVARNLDTYKTKVGKNPDLDSMLTIFGDGDDAYDLFDGTNVIDVYGVVGEDGTGKAWEYTGKAATRKAAITIGSASFDVGQWTLGALTTATPGVR